ncbi:hypothetical protein [Streptomyces sp. enrichment culture]|uniref:hypothetical protein n=1 Tax=Streptomyces sp. enrichment culture TaxID=1795815 RepID=UPI003F560939
MHPNATEAQIEKVAESLRSAHYAALALKSAAARRAKREAAQEAKRRRTEQQLAAYSAGDPDSVAA